MSLTNFCSALVRDLSATCSKHVADLVGDTFSAALKQVFDKIDVMEFGLKLAPGKHCKRPKVVQQ